MRFTLRKKLIASFLSIILIFLITTIISTKMDNQIQKATNEMVRITNQKKVIEHLNLFARSANDSGAWYLICPPSQQQNYMDRYTVYVSYVAKELVEIKKQVSAQDDKEDIAKFEEKWTEYANERAVIFKMFQDGDVDQARVEYTRYSFDPIAFALLNYTNRIDSLMLNYEESIHSLQNTSAWVKYLSVIVAAAIGTILAFLMSHKISNSIATLKNAVVQIADGDLRIKKLKVNSRDEIGELVEATNIMIVNLREVISTADQTASQVAASSVQMLASSEQTGMATQHIAEVIQEIADGTIEQGDNVHNSLQIIHELSQAVQDVAHRSQSVSAAVHLTTNTAISGRESIALAVEQMNSIQTTVKELANSVKSLGNRSYEIGEIINVITDIASRTNLLALNAAIEAARAGEHGKGFSVVANEVRKLAEQSGRSANQISHLIAGIQQETSQAAVSMNTSTEKVEKGIELVSIAGDSFEEIVQSIQDASNQISEVSSANQQIAARSDLVLHKITTISEVAKQSAAGTQNVSAAAEEQLASMEEITATSNFLSSMADELHSMISKFKL